VSEHEPPREPPAPAPPDTGLVPQPSAQDDEPALSLASKMWLGQRAGGIAVPLFTAMIAFLLGGLVVLATGHNPLSTYRDIFNGAGLNWFFHPTTETFIDPAGSNLSQTLLLTTTLTLTGLAVAFAFRCGMFNIGGQGQYFVGLYTAVWIGSSWADMSTLPHILIGIGAATLAGALWAGIAGFLKAAVGAHEVIATIMLNWVAYWVGYYLFGPGGPLQESTGTTPISKDVTESAKLPVFWGEKDFQGLHIGFFIAIAALVIFYLLLNRTTLGYEVRAVGFNPDAAHYGGISVRKNLIRAMAISGAFAGLAGGLDMLGYLYRFGTSDIPVSAVGFLGIAVALLGRNTAFGIALSAFLFAALLFGTGHGLSDSSEIPPDLATNLTYLIQGLIVLFVGADVLILYIWNLRKRARRQAAAAPPTTSAAG
jgi:general nucleoside transport system permease protein